MYGIFQQVQDPQQEVGSERQHSRRYRRLRAPAQEQVQGDKCASLQYKAKIVHCQFSGINLSVGRYDPHIKQRQSRCKKQHRHRRQVFAENNPRQGDRARQQQLVCLFLLFLCQQTHRQHRTQEHPEIAHFPDERGQLSASLAQDLQIKKDGGNRQEYEKIDVPRCGTEVSL